MKKIFLALVLLFGIVTIMFAQGKSYVTVYCPMATYTSPIKLSGDIPSGMQSDYSYYDLGYQRAINNYYTVGKVLNLLAENGYEVEKMESYYNTKNEYDITVYLCSKENGSSASKIIERVKTDDGSDTVEVARYNLQGIPVTEADKGIQIIVYSNYTTKTVVVE